MLPPLLVLNWPRQEVSQGDDSDGDDDDGDGDDGDCVDEWYFFLFVLRLLQDTRHTPCNPSFSSMRWTLDSIHNANNLSPSSCSSPPRDGMYPQCIPHGPAALPLGAHGLMPPRRYPSSMQGPQPSWDEALPSPHRA